MKAVVFYDGTCGLCHRGMRYLAKIDVEGRLRFAPLGGETFQAEVKSDLPLPDSIVFLSQSGQLFSRSQAIAEILKTIGGFWSYLGKLVLLFPKGLRDWGYDTIARNRRRFFSQPEQVCPVVSPELRKKFLS